MARDLSREEDPPSVDDVLDALADADARRIVSALSEPKTASDISEECDIPCRRRTEAGTAHRGLPAVGVDGHSPRRATHDPLLDLVETVTVSLDENNRRRENDRELRSSSRARRRRRTNGTTWVGTKKRPRV